MKHHIRKVLFSLIVWLMIYPMGVVAKPNPNPKSVNNNLLQIATDAYIYGYPLVTMDLTRQVMTNTTEATATHAPINQFFHAREYPDANVHNIIAPNSDTLYSIAWVDVSKEPYILHLPEVKGRYYVMPILSAWTEAFANLGSPTTGTSEQTFAIVGPSWQGSLPAGVKKLPAPTNIVWILGRTYTSGTKEDFAAVHAIQDQYTLSPLNSFGKFYTPFNGNVDTQLDMKTPVRDQVNNMTAETYFTRLSELLITTPVQPQDATIIKKMARIGIVPGKRMEFSKLDPSLQQVLADAIKKSQEEMNAKLASIVSEKNGWLMALKTGKYGTDYWQRALVASAGLGANLPQDSIYPITFSDNTKNPLNGSNRYVLHFDKMHIPPVKGFWSLTMYNDQYFLTQNPLSRYNLGSRDDLRYNKDGSLDIYLQHYSPGPDKESNWLPAPNGEFVLMLRLYWPDPIGLSDAWAPPLVTRV